jgi:hypothetical protein
MSIRNISAPALFIAALSVSLLAPAQEREHHEVPAVRIVNTPSVNVANTPSVNVANTANVNVTNTPLVNVANTPSVNVANTPNVNITNTPTVQLAGTATVAFKSDPSIPIFTKDANQMEPFVIQETDLEVPLFFPLPSVTSSGANVKTVVIEFVSADCNTQPQGFLGPGKLALKFSGKEFFATFPFGQPTTPDANTSEFATAQRTLIFADPGAFVTFNSFVTGGVSKSTICSLSLFGYLIPQ